jgi:hypothetical protein
MGRSPGARRPEPCVRLCAGGLPLFAKTFATEDWPTLRWAEGDRSLLAALRAHRVGLHAGVTRSLRRANNGKTFGLAGFTAFGFVAKLLVVEEQLFTRGENKVRATIYTLQRPVLEFHASSLVRSATRKEGFPRRTLVLAPEKLLLHPGFGPYRTGKCAGLLLGRWSAADQCVTKAKAATTGSRPHCLFLFFACFLTAALARQCFLDPFLLTGLQVKGVTFHFLNDVFLLHLPLEATQSVFERFAFLQSDFSQLNYTPKPVQFGLVSYCKTNW